MTTAERLLADTQCSRQDLIGRPRPLARLHQGVGKGLLVLHAPAGFGKTALLHQFTAELDYRARVVSLDSACVVPEVFAEQLARSLASPEAFQPPSASGKTGDLKAYLSAVVAACTVDSLDPLMVAFDNVHVLVDEEASVELLGWFIETLPEGSEVILSGRALPPLVALDQRVASGSIVVLGAGDLAFDLEEVAAAVQLREANEDAATLLARTGGWPVGVLAALSGVALSSDQVQRPQDVAWERFLVSQVFDTVPAELRGPLSRLSLYQVVEPRVASRALTAPVWRSLCRWLAAHDFLYEPVANGALRLNPLLRSFLVDEYQRLLPDEFDTTLARLIDEALQLGRIAEAIEFARMPGQEEPLADVIEASGTRLIHQGSFGLLRHAMDALPREMLLDRPLVEAIRARLLSHSMRAQEGCQVAERLLADSKITGCARIHATLARMRCLRLLGRFDELGETMGRVHAIDDCDDEALLGELMYQEGEIALSVTADFPRAEALLRQAVEQCEHAGLQPLGTLAMSTLGQLLTMRGNAPGAVTMLTKAAQGWRSVGRSSNLGWVLNNLGMAHLGVGDFESAVQVLEEAREEGLRCENPRNAAYAIASLGDAELALGHWKRAQTHYEEAIKICAEEAPDETLASLSICGLSAALLGQGDLEQADYFIERALLVSMVSTNSFEFATCKIQESAVRSASGDHASATEAAGLAAHLFEVMDARTSVCLATYRLALCEFRAAKRQDASATLSRLDALLTQPWMTRPLIPLVRENPMFAQWAASRNYAGKAFRDMVERLPFGAAEPEEAAEEEPGRFPKVMARSLGHVSVAVGGREVTEEAWSSSRAKELFFLFLSHREGLRKEEAVELLYPELSLEKCNSAFHSNLYRLRKALYQESVIKRDGEYVLNPDGLFAWDVDEFRSALERAEALPAGTADRAGAYEDAIKLYTGPFAEAFYSEWAAGLREQLEERSQSALASLAGFFAARDDYEQAARCMERVLENNGFNEEAAYSLAAYRSKAGQPVAALAFIDDYRRRYEAELGSPVPQRFLHLRERIAAGGA